LEQACADDATTVVDSVMTGMFGDDEELLESEEDEDEESLDGRLDYDEDLDLGNMTPRAEQFSASQFNPRADENEPRAD